ncbi:uncharacterized protein LOC126674997 [Mercurialis annua]|uniref:uncharacterized protein LOC126674997 n=1 Tax=Mercurialis annua TaxID=3986 RepID=UPI00215FC162|nr:uncharacterized protein LOC126674997 [Mercurialis annua]
MVYSVDGGEEVAMATMRTDKPPLHNFNLPSLLKWGKQRHLRCMKISNSSETDRNLVSSDFHIRRSSRSPPEKAVTVAQSDYRKFKRPKLRSDEEEEGIEEVREKLMFDFKAAADKMKDQIFNKRLNDDVAETATVSTAAEQEARPWNLRKRRAAACKGVSNPILGNGNFNNGHNYSPVRGDAAKSPRRLREKEDDRNASAAEQEVRPKFAVAMSKKEIEEDFMALLGHRPPRRPKKRPRNLQKQLDSLFPGLWLSEVSADTYKVEEATDNNGKR